jgi:hypothetical protein
LDWLRGRRAERGEGGNHLSPHHTPSLPLAPAEAVKAPVTKSSPKTHCRLTLGRFGHDAQRRSLRLRLVRTLAALRLVLLRFLSFAPLCVFASHGFIMPHPPDPLRRRGGYLTHLDALPSGPHPGIVATMDLIERTKQAIARAKTNVEYARRVRQRVRETREAIKTAKRTPRQIKTRYDPQADGETRLGPG